MDHATNAPILKKPDLIATSLSGVAASKMAEYIIMMLLALGQHLPDLIALQKKGEWPREKGERFSPQELRNSTVGIVGYGSIGRQVARLLLEFGSTVLATKRDAMHPEDTGYIPEGQGDLAGEYVHRLYPPQALQSMLKECDFVVVSVPLVPETRNLIGANEFAVMKSSAYLIVASRGGIVDEAALYNALRDRKIAGATIDVFQEEPLPAENPLWKLPNVTITPHIAGMSPNYDQRAITLFSENLARYLAGMPLYNRLDTQQGY
jgi:phosphoglycerate dehydrogenase-like enzyme